MKSHINLNELLGEIDIYLLDQILKGRFSNRMKILDAGCGYGRNIIYFLNTGYPVFAIDQSPEAIEYTRKLSSQLAPDLPLTNYQVALVDKIPFSDNYFDVVIASAILHFARDDNHFNGMIHELWRVLEEGGMLFARLASSIGIENKISPLGNNRYHLPDGSDRFLVDEEKLLSITSKLGGAFLDPIKTTNVQNMRCMTTWVIKKGDKN